MPPFRKIVVHTLTPDFRRATRIEEVPSVPSAPPNHVVVRVEHVGINASDANYTAGKYLPGVKPPFDAGFEAVGVVHEAGAGVRLRKGQAVALSAFGCFAEYVCVPAAQALPVPAARPEALAVLVSGLTASIALEAVGEIKRGETVLVTAAAGGTGTFAVQLAKRAGCHVIGTCGSDAKGERLRRLGCDRVVNYKKESLMSVLKKEYPRGVDCVYESVGGDMYEAALKNLATRGRLIVIGFISGYASGSGWEKDGDGKKKGGVPLHARLLRNSSSVRGFFLNNFQKTHARSHAAKLFKMMAAGEIVSVLDTAGRFDGLEQVADALDHMYAGKNEGKVTVRVAAGAARL